MTVRELTNMMREGLYPLYGKGEANAMIRLIFHAFKGWNSSDIIINDATEVSPFLRGKVSDVIRRLQTGEPLQYILGEAYFYGLDLKVSPAVLIPRPETAELVDMIVSRFRDKNDLKVLDIGTGSGAIAIALSRNLPFSRVTAIDVSEDALAVARANAENLSAHIEFIHEDVFKWMPPEMSFDIIVSNPPYIDESEKSDMDRNVLDFEPHSALFVPDDNPLVYYSRIAEIASQALVENGALYLEINPRHCDDLCQLLRHEGFVDIEVHQDIHRRNRFISAIRP